MPERIRYLRVLVLIGICIVSSGALSVSGAYGILNDRYAGCSIGMTVAETDNSIGSLFATKDIRMDDIPASWRNSTLETETGSARSYCLLSVDAWKIIVLFDKNRTAYLKIPCFE